MEPPNDQLKQLQEMLAANSSMQRRTRDLLAELEGNGKQSRDKKSGKAQSQDTTTPRESETKPGQSGEEKRA